MLNVHDVLKKWKEMGDGRIEINERYYVLNFEDGSSKNVSTGSSRKNISDEILPLALDCILVEDWALSITKRGDPYRVIVDNCVYGGFNVGTALAFIYVNKRKAALRQEKFSHAEMLSKLQAWEGSTTEWLFAGFAEMTSNVKEKEPETLISFDEGGIFAQYNTKDSQNKSVAKAMRRNRGFWENTMASKDSNENHFFIFMGDEFNEN